MVPNSLLKIPVVFLACLMLGACGSGGFDPNGILESRLIRLDGEQVALTIGQVDCGVQEDLWTLTPMGEERSVARLTQKARNLQFSDDVQVSMASAYAQIRGAFSLKVVQMGNVRDDDPSTKVADAKVGVKIDHKCFQGNPLVLMGIRHGEFSQTANVVFRFKIDNNDWVVDVVH